MLVNHKHSEGDTIIFGRNVVDDVTTVVSMKRQSKMSKNKLHQLNHVLFSRRVAVKNNTSRSTLTLSLTKNHKS